MIPYLIAAVVGAVVVAKRSPTSSCKKRQALGPRSGLEYEVDDFEQGQIIIVHGDGAIATFQRHEDRPGFKFLSGQGDREILAWMIRDFSPPT